MRIVKLNKEYSVLCESQSTRSGFRHVAIITRNGYEIKRVKCCYLNRTWECYTYQSVLRKALEYLKTQNTFSVSKNLLTRFSNKINGKYGFGE